MGEDQSGRQHTNSDSLIELRPIPSTDHEEPTKPRETRDYSLGLALYTEKPLERILLGSPLDSAPSWRG